MMAELKTKPGNSSTKTYIDAIENLKKRRDCKELVKLMREVTGNVPKMWGSAIIGFGNYHFKYSSGREGDWMITGFSPRKQNIAIYIMPGFSDYGAMMKSLGKFKIGKSCLYIKSLDDIDRIILRKLVQKSVADMRKKYPTK